MRRDRPAWDRGKISAHGKVQHQGGIYPDPKKAKCISMVCTSVLMRKEISFNKDPLRIRKLLLHRKEIDKNLWEVRVAGLRSFPLECTL